MKVFPEVEDANCMALRAAKKPNHSKQWLGTVSELHVLSQAEDWLCSIRGMDCIKATPLSHHSPRLSHTHIFSPLAAAESRDGNDEYAIPHWEVKSLCLCSHIHDPKSFYQTYHVYTQIPKSTQFTFIPRNILSKQNQQSTRLQTPLPLLVPDPLLHHTSSCLVSKSANPSTHAALCRVSKVITLQLMVLVCNSATWVLFSSKAQDQRNMCASLHLRSSLGQCTFKNTKGDACFVPRKGY